MRPFFITRLLILASLWAPFAGELLAQNGNHDSDEPWYLPRVDGEIELDGHVTDEEWGSVKPLPLTVYEPVFEAAPSEETEIRVGYDDQFLYVAGRLHDSHAGAIRANSLYRDRYSGDDTFAIILDTFNDNETGLWFFTTPNGIRFDMALSNDVNFGGGGPFGSVMNSSWNTYWDVATQVSDTGWSAEIRIPYSSLGFQTEGGRVVMGMSTYRYIAHLNERHLFPAIPPNWNLGFAKPSQLQRVVLEDVESSRPVYVTPYGLTGPNSFSELNDAETEYVVDDEFRADVGLDVKYNVTNNLTADLTINTDFAQVEADDQQVNLTRFSLFFPEKRQFFQERSAIFEFNYGFQDRVFHSRQIGVYEGDLIPIYGGARLVGRAGDWDIGLLNMQTAKSTELPSENFGVARLRRRVINPFSTAGGIFTSRIGVDGSYNIVYGADAVLRVTGDEYATVKLAQTHDSENAPAEGFDLLESSLIYASWERRTDQKLAYNLFYQRSGTGFDPGIGFQRREDITHAFGQVSYGWFAPAQSTIRVVQPSLFSSNYFRNEDGTAESAYVGGGLEFEFKSSAQARLRWEWSYEDLRDDTLSFPNDTEILPGTYRFLQGGGRFEMPNGSLIRGGASLEAGTFYDGTSLSVGLTPTWNLSRHVELGGGYSFTVADFPDSNQSFTVHLARLRAQIGFNTKASVAVFVQYNTADDLFASNVRARYNFREGQDLWIVFNQGLNTDRLAYDPVPPSSAYMTILVKYTHTFAL
jgi:hypothetical protein